MFYGKRRRRRIVANLFEIPFPRRSTNNGENEKNKKDGEKPNWTHSWVSQNGQQTLAHAILLQANHHKDLVTSGLLQLPVQTDEGYRKKLKVDDFFENDRRYCFRDLTGSKGSWRWEDFPSRCFRLLWPVPDLPTSPHPPAMETNNFQDSNAHIISYNLPWFAIIYGPSPEDSAAPKFFAQLLKPFKFCKFPSLQ